MTKVGFDYDAARVVKLVQRASIKAGEKAIFYDTQKGGKGWTTATLIRAGAEKCELSFNRSGAQTKQKIPRILYDTMQSTLVVQPLADTESAIAPDQGPMTRLRANDVDMRLGERGTNPAGVIQRSGAPTARVGTSTVFLLGLGM